MTILSFGPVSNATKDGLSTPWFPIIVGGAVLASMWIRYFRADNKAQVPKTTLITISAGCFLMMVIGIWGLVR